MPAGVNMQIPALAVPLVSITNIVASTLVWTAAILVLLAKFVRSAH
jgi:hypothetical protein